jgi:NADP-dependent 3-hydroxy acid dehydrogenase YdfG
MMDAPLASRAFYLDDQLEFARLSSDWNPIHLNANFARRTQVGAPVAHGIHILLWAIESVLSSSPFEIRNIKARFSQPLFLDEIVQIKLRTRTETRIDVEVLAANTIIATIKLSSRPGTLSGETARLIAFSPVKISDAAELPFEQMTHQTGAVAVDTDVEAMWMLFPALLDSVGPSAVRALLATSQVVGMACPGLHSLFAGLDVSLDPTTSHEHSLSYAVTKADPRFRSLQIDVSGSALAGRLDAFARLPPPVQTGMAATSARISKGAFVGQKALIVGGSRGLGEVTAKILAAGGGHPVITYREGKREADGVAADIHQAGGQCEILRYDVLDSASDQLRDVGTFDYCYYFATAKIFQRKSALYEPEKLRTFLNYYADGFYDLCSTLAKGRSEKISIFYPSTIAVDEGINTTAEYAMAKAAGEILAKYINQFLPNIHIVLHRLPRIMTDQTATVGVASAHDALDVMLPIVYEFQGIAGINRP